MIWQTNRGVHVQGSVFEKEEATLSIGGRENDLSLIISYTIEVANAGNFIFSMA